MEKPASKPAIATPSGRGLVLARVFDAPRELVFEAWTRREHLVHWWGQPRGATMPHCTVDLRVGGKLHFQVRTPDGTIVWGLGVYQEIVPPERLVFTDCFSDEAGNVADPPPGLPPGLPRETLITVTFEDLGGKTRVVVEHAGVERTSAENQQAYQQGWSESLDRLAERLAQLQ